MSPTSPNTFCFLVLPSELRIHVYEAVAQCIHTRTGHIEGFSGILLSCKQIFAELSNAILKDRLKVCQEAEKVWTVKYQAPVRITQPVSISDRSVLLVSLPKSILRGDQDIFYVSEPDPLKILLLLQPENDVEFASYDDEDGVEDDEFQQCLMDMQVVMIRVKWLDLGQDNL